MKKEKITIKFGRIGSPVVKIKASEGITIREVIKDFLHPEMEPPYVAINGNKKALDDVLKDNDLLVMVYPIHGEATVRRNGNAWRIHANDKDDLFPSDFHAHNKETGEKLDLYTGYLYNSTTKQLLYALHKKDWLAILLELKNGKEKNLSLKANAVLGLLNKSIITA